jgi:integrin alpha FG-GAP repeat containing protein 1
MECSKKDKVDDGACARGKFEAKRRKLNVVRGPVTDALSRIWDARGAAWLDIDENVCVPLVSRDSGLIVCIQGTLDIVIMRSGKQDGQKITFIKNNMFHDAFFLKALVLNGACGDQCEPTQGGKRYNVGCFLPECWRKAYADIPRSHTVRHCRVRLSSFPQ